MSLYVGNVSRNASQKDLQREFSRYGECRVDLRGSYGFIDFTQEADAEEAKNKLQGANFGGLRIHIDWSKKSGKFDGKSNGRRNDSGNYRGRGSRRSKSRSNSRDNRRDNNRRKGRSRSKSNDRRSRSRSKSSPRVERGTPTYSPMNIHDSDSDGGK